MGDGGDVDVLVIGAGISGLVCAYRLAKAGKRVLVVDAAERAGGVIRSQRVKDFLLEDGPNSFASSPALFSLLDELKLRNQAQVLPMREHDRYVWRGGRLRRVPVSPAQFIASDVLTAGEKLQIARGLMKRVAPPTGDVELGTYLRARLGDGAVDALVKPGLAGIYAQDADAISFQAVLPKVFEHARGSARLIDLIKAMKAAKAPGTGAGPRSIVALDDGVEVLVERVVAGLAAHGGRLMLNTRAQISPIHGGWTVEPNSGETIQAARVVLATPAYAAAQLLNEVAPEAAAILQAVKYAPLAVVQVGVRDEQMREQRGGFGFLSMRNHGLRALGMIWSDRMFSGRAPAGHRLLTCFYGGQIDPAAAQLDDVELKPQLIADIVKAMGYDGSDPALFRVVRLPRALPIFEVGHVTRMQKALSLLPTGLDLLSNFTGGVSIPDRVGRAEELATRLIEKLDMREPMEAVR